MLGFREIVNNLHQLGVSNQYPVIAHINPDLPHNIKGGANTLVGALLTATDNAILPAFTTRTMVIPETGPANNALEYGSGRESNLNVEIFNAELAADEPYVEMANTLHLYPGAFRSSHPVLSFVGLGMNTALDAQNIHQPYAPIKSLLDLKGMVVLMGVDQSNNFSIHYAEHLAGRKQFTRWALSTEGTLECNPFPGCPDGFNKINIHIEAFRHQIAITDQIWQAYSLQDFISITTELLKKDPFSLLCNRLKCERCNAVRNSIAN
jgi:aminoglycoside 3-N-acetyltransferase